MAAAKFDIPVSLSDCMAGCEPKTNGPLIPSFLDWASCASRCMDEVFSQKAELSESDRSNIATQVFLDRINAMRLADDQSRDKRLLEYENQLKFNGAMARLLIRIQMKEKVEEYIIDIIAILNELPVEKDSKEYGGEPGVMEKSIWGRLKDKVKNFISDAGDFLITNQTEICTANAAIVGISVTIATGNARTGAAAGAAALAACDR